MWKKQKFWRLMIHLVVLLLFTSVISLKPSFSVSRPNHLPEPSTKQFDLSSFPQTIIRPSRRNIIGACVSLAWITKSPSPSLAATTTTNGVTKSMIDFVPASPNFQGTYEDAKEILSSQRLAVNNISDVISRGNMEEAGFKVMQLSAQTRMAGKIVLDTFQERKLGSSHSTNDNIDILRYLSIQKKFVTLMDCCEECEISLNQALRGKMGASAAAQLKLSSVVEEAKIAYDDFLGDVTKSEITNPDKSD